VRRLRKVRPGAGAGPEATILTPQERTAAPKPPSGRVVTSRAPNHTWNIDLTVVPTSAGFWVPWLPGSVVRRWPFCWWVAIVLDHFSRAVVAKAVFRKEPTAGQSCALLDAAVARAQRAPKYTITDHGVQFQAEYLAWCAQHGVRPRFGAIGQYGSIAVLERFMRTLKDEGLRLIVVPLRYELMRSCRLVLACARRDRPG
jgi:transposase InsO family protein